MRKKRKLPMQKQSNPSIDYERGLKDGWKAGIIHASRMIDQYMLPAHDELHKLNAIAAYISAIICAGHGDLPKEVLRDANNDLGEQMAKVINTYAYARGSGLLDLPTPDLSRAQSVFAAVTSYLETPNDNGRNLRTLFASWSSQYGDHIKLRKTTGSKPSDLEKQFDEAAVALKRQGLSIRRISETLGAEEQYQPLFESWNQPEEAIKKRLQRVDENRGQIIVSPPK